MENYMGDYINIIFDINGKETTTLPLPCLISPPNQKQKHTTKPLGFSDRGPMYLTSSERWNLTRRNWQKKPPKCIFKSPSPWQFSIKNQMGPIFHGPLSIKCNRAITYSGFFGVWKQWVLLEISWLFGEKTTSSKVAKREGDIYAAFISFLIIIQIYTLFFVRGGVDFGPKSPAWENLHNKDVFSDPFPKRLSVEFEAPKKNGSKSKENSNKKIGNRPSLPTPYLRHRIVFL